MNWETVLIFALSVIHHKLVSQLIWLKDGIITHCLPFATLVCGKAHWNNGEKLFWFPPKHDQKTQGHHFLHPHIQSPSLQNNWCHFSCVFGHIMDTMLAMPVQAISKSKGLGLGLPQMGNRHPGAYLII